MNTAHCWARYSVLKLFGCTCLRMHNIQYVNTQRHNHTHSAGRALTARKYGRRHHSKWDVVSCVIKWFLFIASAFRLRASHASSRADSNPCHFAPHIYIVWCMPCTEQYMQRLPLMQYPRSIIMITTIIWCEYIGWRWTECAAYLQRCSAKHFGCDDDDGDGGCCRNWFVGVDNRICGWFDTILRVIVFVIREAVFFSVKFSSTFIKYLYFICIYHELLLRVESKTIENIEFSSYCCIWMSFHDFLYRKIKTIWHVHIISSILFALRSLYSMIYNECLPQILKLVDFETMAFYIVLISAYCIRFLHRFHSAVKFLLCQNPFSLKFKAVWLKPSIARTILPVLAVRSANVELTTCTDAHVHGTPPETRRIPKNYLMISFSMAFSLLPIN